MKNTIIKFATIGNLLVGIFIFRLIYIAFPDGLQSVISVINLPLDSSPLAVRKAWGQGDAGSLLDVAITWAQGNDIDPISQYWIVRLWSPGLPILEVFFIWIERFAGISIFYSLFIFTLALWLVFFITAVHSFSDQRNRKLVAAFLIIYTFSWDFQYFFRNGLFYTEGISLAMLGTGLLLFSKGIKENRFKSSKNLIFPGCLIGFSVWMRHGIDTGLILLLVISIAFYSISIFKEKFLKKSHIVRVKTSHSLPTSKKIVIRSTARSLFIFAFIGVLVTIPWRIIGPSHYQGVPYMMSSTPSLVGGELWIDSQANPDFYWKDYGMNWACSVDPIKCSEINNSTEMYTPRQRTVEAITSALANPLQYIQVRGKVFLQRWSGDGELNAIQISLSYLVLLLPVFWLLKIRKREFRQSLPHLVIWGSFLFTLIGQLLIIHYESRYFIPLRILIIGCTISLFSQNKTSRSLN